MERRNYSGFEGFRLPMFSGCLLSLAFQAAIPICAIRLIFYGDTTMNENQNVPATDDDFDDLDNLFSQFDGMAVEGGVDAVEMEDDCAGGACKI